MRRLLLLLLVLQAAACGGGAQPDVAGLDTQSAADEIADVLQVSCADGVLTLDANRVRVHADGLHVEVTELSYGDMSVEIWSTDDAGTLDVWSGGAAHRDGTAVLDTVGPGPHLIRCYPMDGPRHMLGITEDDQARQLEVVDDAGHWTQPEPLSCDGMASQMHPDYGTPPAPPAEPVEPLPGTDTAENTDETLVRGYGYPDGLTRWTSTITDGDVVSRTTWQRDGTGWRNVGSTSCA